MKKQFIPVYHPETNQFLGMINIHAFKFENRRRMQDRTEEEYEEIEVQA
jgi:hypothetical protein